jgi:hypothetical protein
MMADRVYCTCFDRNYLSRGLALYHSLQRHAPDSRLWVLCLDQACHQVLVKLGLPGLVPIGLTDFEAADPEVAATRSSRSLIEYYFTCSPAWLQYVLEREASCEWATYLDGDLFFFESPEWIFSELENASFAITPHRYTPRLEKLRKFGIYNVGWVGARNDSDGIAVVKWWRSKCIEWCYDYVDGDRFADQGYLQALATRFPRVKAIENVGANLAPWNIGNYRIEFRATEVLIDATHPLIFFHFQGLKRAMGCFIFNSHRRYSAPFSRDVRDHIYKPYVDEMLAIEKAIDLTLDVSKAKPLRRSKVVNIWHYAKGLVRSVRDGLFRVLDIITGRAFIVFRGRAY